MMLMFMKCSTNVEAKHQGCYRGPGDEDPRPPPHQPVDTKGKVTKKLATRKHKYPDADTVRAATVVEVAERAEREEVHGVVLLL